jgi:Leucine-rich repeat (LRR) protein
MTLFLMCENIKSLWFTKNEVEITFGNGRKETITFPNNLKRLNCSYNHLTALENLPDALEELVCYDNQLTELEGLPQGLKRLNCSKNQLAKLEGLPQELESLSCSENHLTALENLPQGLKELDCSSNQLKILKGIPKNMEEFYCYDNPLFFIEPLPKRPFEYAVPTNLVALHSEDNYSKYYRDYSNFSTNFGILKNLLLLELGCLSLKISEDINHRYYFS